MSLAEQLIEQLIRDEGLRTKPYRDSLGKLSIGIGRNLEARGISEEEAHFMLRKDIEAADRELSRALPWVKDLDEARYGVLVNMTFNMGIGVLLAFKKTLAAVEAGDYELAAQEMLKSVWAEQVGPRAIRLSEQMRTGQWQ